MPSKVGEFFNSFGISGWTGRHSSGGISPVNWLIQHLQVGEFPNSFGISPVRLDSTSAGWRGPTPAVSHPSTVVTEKPCRLARPPKSRPSTGCWPRNSLVRSARLTQLHRYPPVQTQTTKEKFGHTSMRSTKHDTVPLRDRSVRRPVQRRSPQPTRPGPPATSHSQISAHR